MLKIYRNIIIGLAVSCFITSYAATDCNQVTQIPVSECQALLKVLDTINYNYEGNYPTLYSWGKNNQPCSSGSERWDGVVCSNGHVSELDLHYSWAPEALPYPLGGQFPDLDLPELVKLNISYQQFTSLPNFSKLPKLTSLAIANNPLMKDSDISNAHNLTSLTLSAEQVYILNSDKLPRMITSLKINQGNDFYSTTPVEANLSNLNKLVNLESINISSPRLTGSFPSLNLPKLTRLEVFGNSLTGEIPDLNLPNLQTLKLSSNGLNGNIPNFSNMPSLTSLELSDNKLSGNIPNFSKLRKLDSLKLGNNQLSGSIPNFSNFYWLTSLELSDNKLSGNIPDFSNMPSLTSLYLRNNQLRGSIPNFSDVPRLFSGFIDFSNNQLSGKIPSFGSTFSFGYYVGTSRGLFGKNCGLIAYDEAQEIKLNKAEPNWKTLNPNCPNPPTICPLPSISSNLEIHFPDLNYNGMTLSANLRYAPRNGKIMFEVIDYSIISSNCASVNLSQDFKLHIPTATFGDMKLWADLQLYSVENDKITFELIKYGNTN